MGPIKAIVGGGGWRAYLRIGAGLLLLVAAITLFSLRSGSLSVALNVGLAAAFGIVGLGFMVGSLAVPPLRRPQRGARGAGPVRGTRRCRRPPARLRAPDPGADPALGRRRDDGLPPGPRAGARPALLAVRGRGRRSRDARTGAAGGGCRGGGRARRPGRGGLRGRHADHRRRPAPRARDARGRSPTPPSTPGRAPSTSTPRRPRPVSRSSSATGAPGSTPTGSRTTGTVSAAASSDGCNATAATRRCGVRRGRAPRSGCPCRSAHRATRIDRGSPHESTHRCDRRRPRHVPHRRPGRARQLGRRGRRGGRCRPGRGRRARAPAGGGAARRTPPRRRWGRGDAAGRAEPCGGEAGGGHAVPRTVRLGRRRGRDRHDPCRGAGVT